MKVYFLIMLAAITSCKASSQMNTSDRTQLITSLYNGDTSKYIQHEVIDKKANYINKPLGFLLSNIEVSVKSYADGIAPYNSPITPHTSLFFYNAYDARVKMFDNIGFTSLVVVWQTPPNADSTRALLGTSHAEWTQEANDFYGGYLVKDLILAAERKKLEKK